MNQTSQVQIEHLLIDDLRPDPANPRRISEEAPEPPPAAMFKRVPNQNGVEEGQVRLYCDSCQSSFTTPADQQPDNCPEGHAPDSGQQETTEA